MMAGLSNSNNQNNNGDASSKANTGTTLQMVDTASLNELIQNANTQEVVADSTKVELPQPPVVQPPVEPPVDPPCEVDCGTPRGQLQGYAGGVYVTEDHVDPDPDLSHNLPVHLNAEYGTVANHRADEVNFTFNEDNDPETNDTFSARFRLHAGEPDSNEGGILINFDDPVPTGEGEEPRPMIDPLTGALSAFSGSDGITIFHDDTTEAPLIGDQNFAILASSENFAEASDPRTEPSTERSGNAYAAGVVHRLRLL